MDSRVVTVAYRGTGDVGYTPHWWHLVRWREALPAVLIANALLQVLDALSTWGALSIGLTEANPFSAQMMQHFGIGAWVAYKFVLALAFLALIPATRRLHTHAQRAGVGYALTVFGALMIVVVASNVGQAIVLAATAG